MSAQWHPGQLLFAGFEGVEVPPHLAEWIASGRVGGVVLFARNVGTPAQTRSLCDALHELAPPDAPLIIAVDQEGGRVQRLREPWTEWPPMRDAAQGSARAELSIGDIGAALGRELADCGINLNFAPVCDVDTNPDNPVIGDRSFGREPAAVAEHVAAFVKASQEVGVAACAKHFPGHGDTDVDSHLSLPRLRHGLERLRRVEFEPFRAAIAAGVASVMTAHILFEGLDPRWPATLSPACMELLRGELGYAGFVFTDDLDMKAVAGRHGPKVLVEQTLTAGVDGLLACRARDLQEALLDELESAPDRWVEGALERVVRLKATFGGRPTTQAPPAEPGGASPSRIVSPYDAAEIAPEAPPDGPPYEAHRALAAALRRE